MGDTLKISKMLKDIQTFAAKCRIILCQFEEDMSKGSRKGAFQGGFTVCAYVRS